MSSLEKTKKNKVKVAVLMSTYNGEKYIEEQIRSILNQRGEFDLHLLIRDDGSNDLTHEILQKYENIDSISWYCGKNIGPALSFLNLIKENPGYDFYAFADQDDYWKQNKISTAISYIGFTEKPTLYFSNADLVDNNLNSLGRKLYREEPRTDLATLSCAGGILGCSIVFNNDLAKYIQDYPLPKQLIMHDFYISLLCAALEGNVIYNPDSFIKYRQHEHNTIGVSIGIIGTIYGRINDITYKEPVGISKQADELMRIYRNVLPKCSLDCLSIVKNYHNSLLNRFKLAISKKTKYINCNMGIKLRLSILFGNR